MITEKHFTGFALLITMMFFNGCMGQQQPQTTPTTISSQEPTTTITSLDCSRSEETIKNLIDEANYCKEDSDCILSREFDCPFSCYNLINRNSDLSNIRKKIQEYYIDCIHCDYGCIPYPTKEQIKCIQGKCDDIRLID